MKIVTWNINSVRLRLDQAIALLEAEKPDILCLQETKCPDAKFPSAAFARAGYGHMVLNGPANARHGVAILARAPIEETPRRVWCGQEDGRHLAVRLDGVEIHNFYVPAGGDEPDPDVNPKFRHKLDFLAEMRGAFAPGASRILVGDLNVAPYEHDVWSHKQLLNVVSHTPVETDLLKAVLAAGDWRDAGREKWPEPERLFTWWSYRAKDWRASDRGRRLDHVWTSGDVSGALQAAPAEAFAVMEDARSWEKPSDHAPVVMRFS